MRKQVLGTIGVIGIGLIAGMASANSWTYLPAAGEDPAVLPEERAGVNDSVGENQTGILKCSDHEDPSLSGRGRSFFFMRRLAIFQLRVFVFGC